MLAYILFGLGLVILIKGGDWLVKGSVGLAEKMGVSPLVIGLTIVAFGTSAPELVISLDAALTGYGSLAVGNIVGSNIANVLLVLGVPALIATTACEGEDLKMSLWLLVGVTLVFMVLLVFQPLGRLDGLILLGLLTLFLAQQFLAARRDSKSGGGSPDYHDEVSSIPTSSRTIGLFIALGVILLPLGAFFMVDAAVEIATRWNVSEDVIGLTIVAIGTSLPELATGIMAVRSGSSAVALGNVVGSNLFNIAAIMGITATVAGTVSVGTHIVQFDMWVMLAATVLVVAFTISRVNITRAIGSILLLLYAAYLTITVIL